MLGMVYFRIQNILSYHLPFESYSQVEEQYCRMNVGSYVPHNIPLAGNDRVMTFLSVSTFASVTCTISRAHAVFLLTISESSQFTLSDSFVIKALLNSLS